MAPRKKPAGAVERKQKRLPGKAQAKKLAGSVAPSTRTCYAIFFQETKARLTAEMYPGVLKCTKAQNRSVVSAVGAAWRALSEDEKKVYVQRSQQEVAARHQVIQDMMVFRETEKQCADAKGSVGPYEILSHGHPGHSADCCLVQHRVLRTRGRAVFYPCEDEYLREIACLNILHRSFDEDETYKDDDDFFLRLLYATMDREEEPRRCIVSEVLPPLHECGVDRSKWLLHDVSLQMARGVAVLHNLGLLHLDLRPSSWCYDSNSNCTKLCNFRLCRREADTDKLQCHPYLPGYRAPELNRPLDEIRMSLGRQAESWAFGVALVELACGQCMFNTLQEVLSFQAAKHAAKANQAMRLSHAGVQKTLLHFLCEDGMILTVVDFAREPAYAGTFVNLAALGD